MFKTALFDKDLNQCIIINISLYFKGRTLWGNSYL